MSDKELELRCLSVSDWGSEPAMWLRKGDRRRCLTLVMVTVAMSLFALPQGGASSTTPQTYVVFLCGEGYANLCSLVPETGEHRQTDL